jgi:hypothetical protein
MDKIIEEIELKVDYYELFTKIKRAGMGYMYNQLKDFIQNKVTNNPNITLNDFENDLFKKIGEMNDEMNDIPDMIGCGTEGGDY